MIAYTPQERKEARNAKKDYQETHRKNPAGAKNSRNQFVALIADRVMNKRLSHPKATYEYRQLGFNFKLFVS